MGKGEDFDIDSYMNGALNKQKEEYDDEGAGFLSNLEGTDMSGAMRSGYKTLENEVNGAVEPPAMGIADPDSEISF